MEKGILFLVLAKLCYRAALVFKHVFTCMRMHLCVYVCENIPARLALKAVSHSSFLDLTGFKPPFPTSSFLLFHNLKEVAWVFYPSYEDFRVCLKLTVSSVHCLGTSQVGIA